jgi:VIT1/CCC1 family predicted Fe2+/Mn2+ transporter
MSAIQGVKHDPRSAARVRVVTEADRTKQRVVKPDPARARVSALTIALSHVAGGLAPLTPYFVLRSTRTALVATLLALMIFG